MRMLERRLRRLEGELLPPPETEESRRMHEVVMDIRRRRAVRLGLPEPEEIPTPAYRSGMGLAEIIRASRAQCRARRKAEGPRHGNDCPESVAPPGASRSRNHAGLHRGHRLAGHPCRWAREPGG
jgi:hypothetical protein